MIDNIKRSTKNGEQYLNIWLITLREVLQMENQYLNLSRKLAKSVARRKHKKKKWKLSALNLFKNTLYIDHKPVREEYDINENYSNKGE